MAAKEVCQFCNVKYVPPQSFCPKCKQPTRYITANERILWELNEWETSRGNAPPPPAQPVLPRPVERVERVERPRPERTPERRLGRVEREAAARRAERQARQQQARPAAAAEPIRPAAQPVRPAATQPVRPAATQPVRPAAAQPIRPAAAQLVRPAASTAVATQAPRPVAPAARTATAPTVRSETGNGSVIRRARVEAPQPPTQRMAVAASGGAGPVAVAATMIEREPELATVTHVDPAPAIELQPEPSPATVKELEKATAVEAPPKQKRQKPEKPAKAPKQKHQKPEKAPKQKHQKPEKAKAAPKTAGLRLARGETVELSVPGWSGFFKATLMITTYRVAVRRLGRTKWIPLEEVRKATPKSRGMVVEASIEHFRFRTRKLEETVEALDAALREARRPGNRRHDAGVLQEWCDRCEIWDTHTGRIRLWLNRHPVLIFTLFAASAALIRVYVTPH